MKQRVFLPDLCRDTAQINLISFLEMPFSTSKVDQMAKVVKKSSEFNNKNDSYIQEKAKWTQILSAFLLKLFCFTVLFFAE
ncbi:hypothetical protein [Nitrosomonas sp.]|uniref:hypothetical protein n=1 Tax=Nitrosomonas sp. TaxID=42353 RepID=UPI00208AB29D|nr:hypothetical protein [Nitrosomonas sp.]GJL75167.1 MAG: hypothetical protein NMNS02_12730 [Nitrosomonas sp.]